MLVLADLLADLFADEKMAGKIVASKIMSRSLLERRIML